MGNTVSGNGEVPPPLPVSSGNNFPENPGGGFSEPPPSMLSEESEIMEIKIRKLGLIVPRPIFRTGN